MMYGVVWCGVSPAMGRKKKKGHGEAVIPPRSLFDKASMLKVRREGKDQKKNFSLKQQAPFAKPLPSLVKPTMEPGQDNPEWLISEDWALLQVNIQIYIYIFIYAHNLSSPHTCETLRSTYHTCIITHAHNFTKSHTHNQF